MSNGLQFNWKKLIGNLFIILVLLSLFLIYIQVMQLYAYQFESISYSDTIILIYLVFFHACLIMLLWCFFKTMLTDPGKVPALWGFEAEDSDQKRKRYCLICHLFKPDKSHHCFVCNRCVLNMDHHCRNT